ncbi:MAG: beta-ketoacyl-ACP synthase II [Bacteroidota bacterium]|nr:beta-ketoacyl-ACP synthase II [Candidatus Kapabacteria bacterium]MDW8219966.1 beta-ketoacyl-ACP synthase II [Bacteroidota bacterium]
MQRKTIVISGIGAITPIGEGIDAYWEGLVHGKSGAVPISSFDASEYQCQFACEVRNFDPSKYLDRKTLNRLDKYCQFGVITAEMAMRDAKFHLPDMDTGKIGVVYGSGIGGMISYDEQFRAYMSGGPRRVSPFFVPQMIPDMAAGMISIRNKLRGPNYATVSACATSLHAMIDAYMILQHGMADIMICGGAEASITPMAIAGFSNMQALSTRNDSPETASRPYDKDRDGFVMGEGAGAFVMETLESAQARGAYIYAEVAGIGMSADAYHMTAPHPEGEGALRSMQMALDSAGITPAQIDYINTHGTSTPLGDIAEIISIKKLYGDDTESLSKVNISSTKSMTGHLLGAAGAVESIACVLAIKHQTVPPTINVFHQDEKIDVNVTPNKAQARPITYVLNNGFGFGGHNATIIFKRWKND